MVPAPDLPQNLDFGTPDTVEEEAAVVDVDEVQQAQAAMAQPKKRWAAILDSMCSKEKGFDYGGCVLAY
jgi:hypothetical protein